MLLLDLTLPTPDENLALDEALLDAAEDADTPVEVLRFWEADRSVVVLGRSSKAAEEAQLELCKNAGVPVLRRCSGGAAIVAGPGCLMYAVVLSYELHPELRALDLAHRYVLSRLREALLPLVAGVQIRGTSDLTVGESKFSGNSLRCKRSHLLYHGTLLYDFDVSLFDKYLGPAPRQPAYRKGRTHRQFVTNIPLSSAEMKQAVSSAFQASRNLTRWPREMVHHLVQERYSEESWNQRH
ncbi:MAG: lipoate--protein ligase family protein [Pirellulaceae bacterium]|nr:lipoate--protein ligase family protein [Pirellulaceae bacterium]